MITQLRPGPKRTIVCLTTYMRTYKATKRQRAIENGICVHCFTDKSRDGMRTCEGCAEAHQIRKSSL